MEGSPIQELAAIEINRKTFEIEDVFHAFAFTKEDDSFARKHVHGLSKNYLKQEGFCSETSLLAKFRKWLVHKPNVRIFCNDAQKESKILGIKLNEFKLLPWVERRNAVSHKVANRFKKLSIPILGRKCTPSAHACFVSAPFCANPLNFLAKTEHHYHCALYDVLELFYESIMLDEKSESLPW